MALLNHAKKELSAKIVYYGPGLSGKTTNLEWIHRKLSPEKRGKLISLETKTDRTLFFDFLPVQIGDICGYKTRFNVYTVPGQIFYNETRRVVLKGVDGVVFVADSQKEMANENLENLKNLAENLRSIGKELFSIPLVLQYNKRDLNNVLSIEELNGILNPKDLPFFESVAMKGEGVLPVLSHITRMVAKHLEDTLFPSSQPSPEQTSGQSDKAPDEAVKQESVSVSPTLENRSAITPEKPPSPPAQQNSPKAPSKKPPPLPAPGTASPPLGKPADLGMMENPSIVNPPPTVPEPLTSAPELPQFSANEPLSDQPASMLEPASLFENPPQTPPLAPTPSTPVQTANPSSISTEGVPAAVPTAVKPELPTFLVDEPANKPSSLMTELETSPQQSESFAVITDQEPSLPGQPDKITGQPIPSEMPPIPDLPILETPDIGSLGADPAAERITSLGDHDETIAPDNPPAPTVSAAVPPLVTVAAKELETPAEQQEINLLLGSPVRKAQNEINIPIALRLEGTKERISFQLSIKIDTQ